MTTQAINKRRTWLSRAGLMVGIAGIVEMFIWGLFRAEGGPSWGALLPASAFTIFSVIPLLGGLYVSWKRPLIGGLFLIGMGIVIFIAVVVTYFRTPSINPISELLLYATQLFSYMGLPYLLPGILFILAARQNTKTQK